MTKKPVKTAQKPVSRADNKINVSKKELNEIVKSLRMEAHTPNPDDWEGLRNGSFNPQVRYISGLHRA